MKLRINLIFLGFLFWLVVVIFRLVQLQVFSGLQVTSVISSKSLDAERGKIFDKNGNILATNEKFFRLYIDKNKFDQKNKDELVKNLSEILEIEESSISAKLNTDKIWVLIDKNVSIQKRSELEKKIQSSALVFEEYEKRFYPEASLSAHLIGFVGRDKDDSPVGYFGLEGYYNEVLQGLEGVILSERGGGGLPFIFGTQKILNSDAGADLYLFLEKGLQQRVKKRLKTAIERYGAKMGCVIVANPQRMAILALSCLPDYDPNKYFEASPEAFVNPAISNVYEPGSIFKPLVVAAALQEKKITPNTYVDEDGPIQIKGAVIRTWDNKYEGSINIVRVLQRSSNVGMVRIGALLGNDNLYRYLDKFGFFEKTGIDLQGEVNSLIKPQKQWYPVDYATVTFGQGIAVTPIQMITAFSAIINGGNLYTPQVVEKIVKGDREKIIKPELKRQVISEHNSELVRQMLKKVVENGEVNWDVPKGYEFGGKTGTAQIAIQGKYDPEKTLASFIGFFPVDNPTIIVMTMLKEPSASIWGSETAAPLFFQIARDIIIYYNILPE